MFADDTPLLALGKNIEELYAYVNEQLYIIATYFRINKLALHPEKTKFMLFTNSNIVKNNNCALFINNNNANEPVDPSLIYPVLRVHGTDEDPAIKFLGIMIDPKLNFKYHVKMLMKKLSSALYFMRNAKNILSAKSLKFIYHSIFHSHLIYGIHTWSSCSQSTINEVFRMQKKAIRIINNAAYNSHTESLFKSSCILPVPMLITFFKLQFMQNYVQGFLPSIYNDLWITAAAQYNDGEIRYALRNSENLYIPLCRLATLNNHPYFLFPKLWSNFDDESVKIIRDKSEFKSKLKLYFLNKLSVNYSCTRLLCPHCHIQVGSATSSESDSSL